MLFRFSYSYFRLCKCKHVQINQTNNSIKNMYIFKEEGKAIFKYSGKGFSGSLEAVLKYV